jgi:thioredoxin 1
MKKVIKYWGSWCGPCKIYAPVFNSVRDLYKDEDIEFIDVNVEEESEYRNKYKVTSIPYTVIEENGVMIKDRSGLMSQTALIDFIKN